MHKRFRFRRTTLITLGLAAFLGGLGIARTKIQLDGAWVWLGLVLVLVTARQKRWPAALVVVLFGLTLGWWRGSGYMKQLDWYGELANRPVIVQGIAGSDAIYTVNSQLSFDLTKLQVQDPEDIDLVGKLSIKGFGEPMIYKGDHVQVEGKLYPTRGSRSGSISFAQIKILEKSVSPIDSTRRRFAAGMESALPEPQASFGLGLLIGQRNTLPDRVTTALAAVGLTHVVAVSGYNLTIIMRGVRRLLKKSSKYQNTLVSVVLIGLFLLLTGFSASIVRAAIVSLLSLWAWYYGRTFRPILLLLLAAAITAGFYPLYLWSDIGWYLSFLAFFGVLVIAPLVTKRLYKNKEPNPLTALVFESIAAQLMTVPLIMYIFGQFSVIALVANVLVVPLVPVAMALSLVAGLAGMLIAPVAGWLAWPARLLLTYMLDIVNLLARLPHALSQQNLGLGQMLALYGITLFVIMVIWHRSRNRGKRDIIPKTSEEPEGV
jgi:competence protein ComEC